MLADVLGKRRNLVAAAWSAGIAALAGLGWGIAGTYLIQASDGAFLYPAASPDVPPAVVPVSYWPDPTFFALAGAVCGALAFVLARLAAGSAAYGLASGFRERVKAAGLDLPGHAEPSVWDPSTSEDALEEAGDKAAAYVLTARKEGEKFKEALAKYADPSLARKLNMEKGYQQVPTVKKNAAILFCDIRGFTKLSETLKVEEVVSVLNDYFTFGAQLIHAKDGQVNKFIGDAILAIFQDPPQYASGMQACRNAVAAALELQASFGRQKNQWRDRIATPFESGLGVGVHFGEVILANMGSPERMEYTCIGDTVNFASRLCSLATAGQVRLSQECYGFVNDRYTADESEPVKVKGKSGEYKTMLVTGKKPGNF